MLSSVIRWSACIAVAALLNVQNTAFAQAATSQTGQGNQNAGGYQANTAFPETYQQGGYFYPGVEFRALPGARANAAVAWAQYHRAEKTLSLLVNDAARKFKRSDELKKAKAEEQSAWDSLNAIRADATNGVKSDDSYKASRDLQKRLEIQIQDARHAETPQLDRVITLATLKLSYAATTSAMEAAAVSSDSRVMAARQRLVDASRQVAALRQQYDDTVRGDPQIGVARQNLEETRTAALGAEVAYIEASRVANVALDFAYHLYQQPSSGSNIYGNGNGYGGYGYGGYGTYGGGFQVGYPIGYPLNGTR